VLSKLAYLMLCRSIPLLALLARGDAHKDLEILVLHHQLAVLRRHVPQPTLEPADRALLAAVSRVLPRAGWSCFFVKPETLLRWHRRLVAGAWTYPRRGQGRPPLDQDVQQLIIRLAKENPRWGSWGALMRSCSSPVLVEQAAEQIASVHLALPAPGNDAQLGGWIRRLQAQRPVRAVLVVVLGIDP
jgi:hypothetical protein